MLTALSVGFGSSIGGKESQEDRVVCIHDMAEHGLLEVSCDVRISFFAVYDGHGGAKCSQFLFENFHVELGRHAKLGFNPLTAIRETWASMDRKFYDRCVREAHNLLINITRDGSTATIAVVVGDDLYVANCGDSAAGVVLSSGEYESLTEDHGTTNPIEVERVKSAGGLLRDQSFLRRKNAPWCCFLERVHGKPRLSPGGLLVTRSFGDFHAKVDLLGGISDVVIPTHGVIRYKKLDSAVNIIILASDGLWDAVPIEKIVEKLGQSRSVM
jgi:serine/threonine protein phosphatase PrpC